MLARKRTRARARARPTFTSGPTRPLRLLVAVIREWMPALALRLRGASGGGRDEVVELYRLDQVQQGAGLQVPGSQHVPHPPLDTPQPWHAGQGSNLHDTSCDVAK